MADVRASTTKTKRRNVRCKALVRGSRNGLSGTPEYAAWTSAIRRCHHKRDPAFKNYSGRGIGVCERWLKSFEAFLEDMGPRPSSLHSLDRWPNKNGHYEPGNCRWTDQRRQMRNIRRNVLVVVDGREMTIAEAAEQANVSEPTLRHRLAAGWPLVDALKTPTANQIVDLAEACEVAGLDFGLVTARMASGLTFREAAAAAR